MLYMIEDNFSLFMRTKQNAIQGKSSEHSKTDNCDRTDIIEVD